MNVDMLLSLSSDTQSNTKVVSSKSESDFLSVLDLKLDDEDLENIFTEEENVDEQLLQILSLLLMNINTNKQLDEKETTGITIEDETKENSELQKLKGIVSLSSGDIQSNTKVISSKSESDCVSVLDNEGVVYIFKQDTQNRDLINKLMSVEELYRVDKTENDNKMNSLSNNVTNVIENLYINNDVQNNDYINKIITQIINNNVSKENYELTTLSSTKEILFEVNKLQNSTSYSNEISQDSSDELNILNSIAFSNNSNKDVQLQKSTVRNKDELNNELDLVNTINISKNNSDIKFEEVYIRQSDIRQGYMTKDIVQTVKYLKNNNLEELSVKMNPKELGEININLLKIDGEEKCVITLSNEDTFNLLKDNINEIKNHLSSLDIKVKEIYIEIRSDNQNNFSDSLNENSNKNNNKEEKKNNNKIIIEDVDNYLDNDDTNINLLV